MHSIAKLLQRNGFVDVAFIHLHPIETGVGWSAAVENSFKNTCFQVLRTLSACTGGRLNFDNLFVVARKGAATQI
jgi:hypothetical protein